MTSTKSRSKGNSKAKAKAAACQRLKTALQEAIATENYPLTVRQMAARSELSAEETLTLLKGNELKALIIVANSKFVDSPLALAEDKAQLGDSKALLDFATEQVRSKRKVRGKTLAGDIKKFLTDSGVSKPLQEVFATSLSDRIKRGVPQELADVLVIKPPTAKEIAQQLINLLKSPNLKAEGYPLTEQRLFELAGIVRTNESVDALKGKAFSAAAVRMNGPAKGAPGICLLAEDLGEFIGGFVGSALQSLSRGGDSSLHSAKEIADHLGADKASSATIEKEIEAATAAKKIPGHIGWLRLKGRPLYFSKADIESADRSSSDAPGHQPPTHPAITPHSSDFARAFDAAFARVDARNGRNNFAQLLDLRRELPQFSRAQFDAGLLALENTDRYVLDAAQGGAVKLSEDQRAAGIQRGGSLLMYVKRI